jgi:hypothetical protein
MVGESTRTIQYDRPRTEALADLERAFGTIGRVVEVSIATGTIIGRCRYGLQSVKLRVSVIDQGDGRSLIEIGAAADDVWGAGARKGTDKLVAALGAIAAEGPERD